MKREKILDILQIIIMIIIVVGFWLYKDNKARNTCEHMGGRFESHLYRPKCYLGDDNNE